MKDIWFSDSRDIVKWGVVAYLAQSPENVLAVQLAFYRPAKASEYKLRHVRPRAAEEQVEFPQLVLKAFQKRVAQIRDKALGFKVELYDTPFIGAAPGDGNYRERYIADFLKWIVQKREHHQVVLLVDPDTGLQRSRPGPAYVKNVELKALFAGLQSGDWLVLYQHAPRREEWIEDDRVRVSQALGVDVQIVHVFDCADVAEDVAFFAIPKN